jgi:hypothetical protein
MPGRLFSMQRLVTHPGKFIERNPGNETLKGR